MIKGETKSNTFLTAFLITLLSFGLIGGCGGSGSSGNNSDQLGEKLQFTNVTFQAGLIYAHGFILGGPIDEPKLISGGVAAGNYDRDGWVDLYVVGGTAGPNLLFRNLGNGSFQEVGQLAGVDLSGTIGSGPIFADYSGDGFLDLFIGGIAPTEVSFFLNNGNGTFTNITAGATDTKVLRANTFSAAFGDYDLDNDLDLYITHWGLSSGLLDFDVTPEQLWRNNGDMTFTDVSIASGIAQTYQGDSDFTFSPNFADINNDGYPDILIAGDFGTSQVFINQRNGTFVNTTDANVITDRNGMGAAVGDYDNDGDLDWFVSSIYDPEGAEVSFGNRFYRNKGDGTFEDVTVAAGVEHGFWGWGSCMYDFDNDGNLDIAHVNGFLSDNNLRELFFFNDPSRLFISNGDGTFTERAFELGLDDTGQGRGIVCFDYDRDGDVDIFITNNNQSPKLFRNDGGNTNNFLNIKLNGLPPNTEGVGARITITVNNQKQMRELRAGSNFVSQNPVQAHFGLGDAELVNKVQVNWLDGEITVLENVSPNQFFIIDHPDL